VNFKPFRTVEMSTETSHLKDDPARREFTLFSEKGHSSVILKPIKVSQGLMCSRPDILTAPRTSLLSESSEHMDTEFSHHGKLDELQRKLELQILIERYKCFVAIIHSSLCF
jgi:hypothetical protein